jgi:hypothetical protein
LKQIIIIDFRNPYAYSKESLSMFFILINWCFILFACMNCFEKNVRRHVVYVVKELIIITISIVLLKISFHVCSMFLLLQCLVLLSHKRWILLLLWHDGYVATWEINVIFMMWERCVVVVVMLESSVVQVWKTNIVIVVAM